MISARIRPWIRSPRPRIPISARASAAARSRETFCHLVDVSERSDAEIKGAVLTRLAQLALRWVFSNEPVARLRDLLALIDQIDDRETAVEVLESLLRY
jgi:hypothetical protein